MEEPISDIQVPENYRNFFLFEFISLNIVEKQLLNLDKLFIQV